MDITSKKFNILACCAAGNGCCQLVSLKVKRVFTKLGLKCNVEANTVSVGKAIGQKYDVVYCRAAVCRCQAQGRPRDPAEEYHVRGGN